MKKITKNALMIFAGLFAILSLNGCSEEYDKFVTKHGSNHNFYCDEKTGFFMHEYMYGSYSSPMLEPVVNDLRQPVRCGEHKNINVKVVESSVGSSRVF